MTLSRRLRPIRLAWFVLVAMAVAGCATRLAYDNADFLVSRYVGGYVSLDPVQDAQFDVRLQELLSWHRSVELPAYAAWLDGIAAVLEQRRAVTPGEVAAWTEGLAGFWRSLGERLGPELVALGGTLDDSQVDRLLGRLREDHAERVAEYAERDEPEAHARRMASMERFLRRWTGRLSPAQRGLVEDWAHRLEPTTERWLASRSSWADELEAALQVRDDRAAFAAAVERLFVDPSRRWDPDYRAALEHNAAVTSELLASLINDLDARQRARARDRIDGLARTLERLAADS